MKSAPFARTSFLLGLRHSALTRAVIASTPPVLIRGLVRMSHALSAAMISESQPQTKWINKNMLTAQSFYRQKYKLRTPGS
jgi:hypothetical protein